MSELLISYIGDSFVDKNVVIFAEQTYITNIKIRETYKTPFYCTRSIFVTHSPTKSIVLENDMKYNYAVW